MAAFSEQRFLTRLGQSNPALRDDVALLSHDTLLTVDMLVQDTHFSWAYFTPYDLGWKAIAVNASDIAATGGMVDGVLLALSLPAHVQEDDVTQFYAGVTDCLNRLPQAPTIWGGDTTQGPCWTVAVTAMGHIQAGHTAGRRWLAQPGDRIIATGVHGLSHVGLSVLQQDLSGYPHARQQHLRPRPRWQHGVQLAAYGVRYALMDSSDGLADVGLKIAQASQVDMVLWLDALPVHPELAQWVSGQATGAAAIQLTHDTMLYGGEDFELIATWAPQLPMPDGWITIGQVAATPPDQAATAWALDRTLTRHQPVRLQPERTYQHFGGPVCP
jgi:thiamine-monophosphate kinase